MIGFLFTNIAYASVDTFIHNVNRLIINPLITLLFALALAFFVYGVLEFLMNQENEEKRSDGKKHMLYGLLGLTIMFGVWAILGLVLNTFGIKDINPETGSVKLNDYPGTYPQVGQ